MSEQTRLARVALSMLARPGSRLIAARVEELGVEAALLELTASLAERGVAAPTLVAAGDCLERAGRAGVRFVTPEDAEWPARLGGLDAASFGDDRGVAGAMGLWMIGGSALDEAVDRSVGIVGSRAPTDYGVRMAMELAHDLGEAGWTVISGAAYGIDAAAHRGALAVGRLTVAVLAGGVDVRYPSGNAGMLERIAAAGLIVSEVPMGMAATRERFLVRNRLIAALANGTVLVEAGLRSGARNTFAHARALNRHVMAVPGQVTSAMSVGPHLELRREGSVLVTSASDVLETLAAVGDHLPPHLSAPVGPRDGLSGLEALVLDATPVRSARASSRIATVAGVDVIEAGTALMRLQAAGLVMRAEGGWRLTQAAKAPKAASGS